MYRGLVLPSWPRFDRSSRGEREGPLHVVRLQSAEDQTADDQCEHSAEQQAECQRDEFAPPVTPIHDGPLGGAQRGEMADGEPCAEAGDHSQQVDGGPRRGGHAEHRQGGHGRDQQQESEDPGDRAGECEQGDTDECNCNGESGRGHRTTGAYEGPVGDDAVGHHARCGATGVDVF